MFDDPVVREAYRRGAKDASQSACIHVPAARQRAVDEWLKQLNAWEAGDPPTPPYRWEF